MDSSLRVFSQHSTYVCGLEESIYNPEVQRLRLNVWKAAVKDIQKGRAQDEEDFVAAESRNIPVFGIERLDIHFIRINYNRGVSLAEPHGDPQGYVFRLLKDCIYACYFATNRT